MYSSSVNIQSGRGRGGGGQPPMDGIMCSDLHGNHSTKRSGGETVGLACPIGLDRPLITRLVPRPPPNFCRLQYENRESLGTRLTYH